MSDQQTILAQHDLVSPNDGAVILDTLDMRRYHAMTPQEACALGLALLETGLHLKGRVSPLPSPQPTERNTNE